MKFARAIKHIQLTPEGFREIAEAAIEAVCADADSMELHDIRTWNDRLKRATVHELEYGDVAGVGESADQAGGE